METYTAKVTTSYFRFFSAKLRFFLTLSFNKDCNETLDLKQ